MYKKLFILGLFLFIFSQNINASEQYPDIIIYDGNEYEIGTYPMETYFKIYPGRSPGIRNINSALKRGYRAKYEIINNELILNNIEIMRFNGNWKSEINRYYFRNNLKVNTYTGRINLFIGEITGVYMAFTPIYENYIILEINKGNLINVYSKNCYEYIELIMNEYTPDSYEYKYFNNKLMELRRR